MSWVRRRYRGHKVWILTDEGGRPRLDDRGLASLRYHPEDTRTYSVRAAEILDLEEDPRPPGDEGGAAEPIEAWVRVVEGGPGRATGLGIVLLWRHRQRDLSRTLVGSTAGRGYLEATLDALRAIRRPELSVCVHIDRPQVLERLRADGETKSEDPLEDALRREMGRFTDLRFEATEAESASAAAVRAGWLARKAAGLAASP